MSESGLSVHSDMLQTKTMAAAPGEKPAQVALLFAVLAVLSVVVVFWVFFPPLNDYPNHLARTYILSDLDRSPLLQQYYRNVMSSQPNLAMDVIVPLLAKVVPLQLAGKLFIALTLVLTAGGTLALHRAVHRHWSVWPCIAFLFVFHRMLLWGLLNYCFGIGLALCTLAAWIALRDRNTALRIAASVILAACVYLSHIFAFGFFALSIAGVELVYLARTNSWAQRIKDLLISGIQFIIPTLLFFFASGKAAVGSETSWGSFWRKLEAPFDVIYQYHLSFDLACMAVIVGLVALGFLRRRMTFDTILLPSLILLTIACVVMPDELFTGWGADRRLPITVLLVFIAACDWRPAGMWWREPAVIVLVAMFVVRMGLLAQVWHSSDAVYATYFKAFDQMPRGAKLLGYTLHNDEKSLSEIPDLETPCMAIFLRDAFVPNLFTSPPLSSESVAYTPAVEEVALKVKPNVILLPHDIERLHSKPEEVRALFAPDLIAKFDFVLINHPEALPKGALPAELKTVYRTPNFVLLSVPKRKPI